MMTSSWPTAIAKNTRVPGTAIGIFGCDSTLTRASRSPAPRSWRVPISRAFAAAQADQPGISRGSLDDRRQFTIQSLQTDWSWRALDTAALNFGAEWHRSEGRYQYRDDAEFDLVFDVPNASSVQGARTRGRRSAPRRSVRRIRLLARRVLRRFRSRPACDSDHSTLGADEEHWSPRVNALYRFSESTFLRASWGRFVQTQSIDELPASDGVASFDSAQRADHWLLSFEQRLGESVDLRVEGYRKRYSQLRPRFENLLNTLVILPELKPDRIRIAPPRARERRARAVVTEHALAAAVLVCKLHLVARGGSVFRSCGAPQMGASARLQRGTGLGKR